MSESILQRLGMHTKLRKLQRQGSDYYKSQDDAAIMESTTEVPQKIKNRVAV